MPCPQHLNIHHHQRAQFAQKSILVCAACAACSADYALRVAFRRLYSPCRRGLSCGNFGTKCPFAIAEIAANIAKHQPRHRRHRRQWRQIGLFSTATTTSTASFGSDAAATAAIKSASESEESGDYQLLLTPMHRHRPKHKRLILHVLNTSLLHQSS